MSENKTENQEVQTAPEKASVVNKKKLTLIIVLSSLALCLALLLGFAGSYDKTYPNTYVDGVSVGGLSYDELLKKCEEISSTYSLPEKIRFSLKGKTLFVPCEEVDISFSPEKTAKNAFGNREKRGFFKNSIAFFTSLFTKTDIKTGVSYNKAVFDELISDFAKGYETKVSDASYEARDGKLILTKAHNGLQVNKSVLEEKLGQYLKNPVEPIEIPFSKYKGEPFDLDTLYKELSSAPTDAYYERNADGEIVVVPDTPQVFIDKKTLKEALEKEENVVTIKANVKPAKITKEDLEDALFKDTIGSWTSYFSATNYSRSANVALSASRIDGKILLPGETFSYDKTVGPRTSENGFKVAGVYINNKVEQGLGGGICQTSSTLYSAVLYANLEIVERTSHSLPVSYMPPGQDATIAEGVLDFVFKNNTDYPIKISATIKGGSITCEIIGTPVEGQRVSVYNSITRTLEPTTQIEKDETIPIGCKKTTLGEKGYGVFSQRVVYQDDVEVKREDLTKSLYYATPNTVLINPADEGVPLENLTELSISVSAPSEEEMEGEQTEEEKEIVEV